MSHEDDDYIDCADCAESECALDAAIKDRDTLRAQLAAVTEKLAVLSESHASMSMALDAVTAERDKLQRAYDESAQKADSHRRLYEQALRTMDGMHEARGALQRECDGLRALSESRRRLYDSAAEERDMARQAWGDAGKRLLATAEDRDEALSAIYDYLTSANATYDCLAEDKSRVKDLTEFERLMVKHAYHVPEYDAALNTATLPKDGDL